MLCYAVKNIIHPDIILHQIPQLLALLSNVESYRQQIHTLAKDVLAWNDKHFRETGDIALTYDEDQMISQVAQEGDNPVHRSVYRNIVFDLCELVNRPPPAYDQQRPHLT